MILHMHSILLYYPAPRRVPIIDEDTVVETAGWMTTGEIDREEITPPVGSAREKSLT